MNLGKRIVAAAVGAGLTLATVAGLQAWADTSGGGPLGTRGNPMFIQPSGATWVTNSGTGSSGATSATLPATAGKTTYLCGFDIQANATSASTGAALVSNTIGGTLSFEMYVAALASGMGVLNPYLGPFCIPASAQNTTIVVTSPAPGSGGTVTVAAWGYQL